MTGTSQSLADKKVLVVEDNFFVASDIERVLTLAGATVTLCIAAAEGLRILAAQPHDCAVLDINVKDGTCYRVADHLRKQATPFVFTTGYDGVRPEFADIPIFQKPFDPAALVRMLARMSTR